MVDEPRSSERGNIEHSGFVGLIGRPNVGKSTLTNQLAKRKLAIVSDKPQTTRHALRAVLNLKNAQIILIDTPGFHKPKDKLGRRLNQKVKRAIKDVDVILFMTDAQGRIGTGDRFIASELKNARTPVVMALNKIDLISDEELSAEYDEGARLLPGAPIVEISALRGDGMDSLISHLVSKLPPGPKYYPDDQSTDQPERVLMAEFIREQVIEATREEVPYAAAVEIYEVHQRQNKDIIDVYARIHVERSSQKGIIIGNQGKMLENIGRNARLNMEKLLGSQVYLDLIVVVSKNWRGNEKLTDQFGY